jgi:hypothetical protein
LGETGEQVAGRKVVKKGGHPGWGTRMRRIG